MTISGEKERPGEATDFDKLPLLRYYEERRAYPRIDLAVPVVISTRGGEVLRGRSRNVSAEGMQLRCDRSTAKQIHPEGTQIKPGAGPTLAFRFELAIEGEARRFTALGRLTYLSPCPKEQIAFGVQFIRIGASDKAVLAEFIMDSLRPPPGQA